MSVSAIRQNVRASLTWRGKEQAGQTVQSRDRIGVWNAADSGSTARLLPKWTPRCLTALASHSDERRSRSGDRTSWAASAQHQPISTWDRKIEAAELTSQPRRRLFHA